MYNNFKKYTVKTASIYFNHCSSQLFKLIVGLEYESEERNNNILEESRRLHLETVTKLRQLEVSLKASQELIDARKAHAQQLKNNKEFKRRANKYLAAIAAEKLEAGNSQMALPPNSFLISLLIPSTYSEDIILNMEELFEIWVGRHGNKKARRIFKLQMFGVIFQHWIKPIKKLVIAAASYLGLTSIYELFK